MPPGGESGGCHTSQLLAKLSYNKWSNFAMQPRLFQLGNDHLLLNGDSTDAEHLSLFWFAAKELGINNAEICLTDPPYN